VGGDRGGEDEAVRLPGLLPRARPGAATAIPIDPFYLTWAARRHGINTRFIELAGEINTAMPRYVVARVAEALNEQAKPIKGSHVLILGVANKKDVDDPRESPAFEIMELLRQGGAHVAYNGPVHPVLPAMRPTASVSRAAAWRRDARGAGLRRNRDRPLGLQVRVDRAARPGHRGHPERHRGVGAGCCRIWKA